MQSNKELADLYRIRFDKNFLPRKYEIWKVLCNDFFQRYINENDVVIDVACGYGEFINNIHSSNKIGIDLKILTALAI